MPRFPTLFVSHGAPTLILEPDATGPALAALASQIPRPSAVLLVSAHWDTESPQASLADAPETIHDFHGFPQPLYEISYPAPGAPALARRAQTLLSAAGLACALSPQRGLDHGAWVPLAFMYPNADIPVTQLSIQSELGARHHFEVGQALAALREESILIVASGAATHNLREFRGHARNAPALPWATSFAGWLADRLQNKETENLLDYRRAAPEGVRNHPTEDHIAPLFVAFGAGGSAARVERIHSGFTYGILSMDHYRFD
jgi:4,5-DOPA dioxygenase extradiol